MLDTIGLVLYAGGMSLSVVRDEVLSEIEDFLRTTGMAATAFGSAALNDPTLVHELRRGRECKRATREKIRRFLERGGDA